MRNVASSFRESCLSRQKTISGSSRRIHDASDLSSLTSSVNRSGRSFRQRSSNRSSRRVTFMLLLPRTSVYFRLVIRRLSLSSSVPSFPTITTSCLASGNIPVSYTHLRAHETRHDLVCRLLLEKKKKKKQ